MNDALKQGPSLHIGDENGGHRLVAPDHETALALADAPRSLRNYVAALQAENERLRAEMEDYRTNGAAAVRFAPNSAHWSNELRRLFGDDARAGIEVLENWHLQELARADGLAEALRELVAVFSESGMYDEEVFVKARAALAERDELDAATIYGNGRDAHYQQADMPVEEQPA